LPEVFFYGDDLGNGPGIHREVLTIMPKTSERFDIIVRVHSGAETVGQANPELLLKWRGAASNFRGFLLQADARDWHVASFIRGHTAPYAVELPAEGFQSGRGWTPSAKFKGRHPSNSS
jgi:hypothetical protein